jgi:EpsD family peptidyl-prolyl cis-trans isomerase
MNLKLALVVIGIAALGACSRGGETREGATKTATQVVAKVNGQELTFRQLESVLRQQNIASNQDLDQAKRVALDALVDQQVVVQQAIKDKIDRDPEVLSAIEAARSKILGQAYVARVAALVAKPSEAEQKAFFEKHPELFSQRRIYQVDELAIPVTVGADAVRAQIAKGAQIPELAAWLTKSGIKFGQNRGAQAAEGLPMAVAKVLGELKEGDITVLELPGGIQAVKILKVRNEPVAFPTAQAAVERYLMNERQRAAMTEKLKSLRADARVEWVGEFAAAKPDSRPAPATGVARGDPPAAKSNDLERGLTQIR